MITTNLFETATAIGLAGALLYAAILLYVLATHIVTLINGDKK